MPKIEAYENAVEIQWCPGCPNFGILQAFKIALTQLHKAPHEVCFVSGIGQAAKLPHYLKCNFFNGLHGRAIPLALGIHVVNPKMTTIVVTGDGDCYGEGGNHFLHALRRNPDITVVVHNNEVYALTKGQASPTTPTGEKRTLQTSGVEITPLNMPAIAILHGCTFVARGFAGDVEHLKEILVRAVKHRGLSYVDVVQPCITWGRHPLSWYKEKIIRLGDDYDPSDRGAALERVLERDKTIPIGVLYEGLSETIFAGGFREKISKNPLTELKPPGKAKMNHIISGFAFGGE
ncbi:MAG: 2-oxoacid ferredoxin oxidoreductase [Deltaproteobacteria bacterium]|nr:2-oxoacid ferredoxin oxidoreductase [Deltaproteobacteria bacterium]